MVELQGTYLTDTVRITTLLNPRKFCLFAVFVVFILLLVFDFVCFVFICCCVCVSVCLFIDMRLH